MKNQMKKIFLAAAAVFMLVPAFSMDAKGSGKIISINKPKTNNSIAQNFFKVLTEDLVRFTNMKILIGQPEKADARITGAFKVPQQGRGYAINFKIINRKNESVLSSYLNANVHPGAMKNGQAAHETAYNLLANLGIKFSGKELEELRSLGVKVKGDPAPKAAPAPERSKPLVAPSSSKAIAAAEPVEEYLVDFTVD